MQLRSTLAFLALAAAAACSQDVTPQSGTKVVEPAAAPSGATAQPADEAAKPEATAPAAAPAADADKPAEATPAAGAEQKEEGKKAE